jgi:hypothetical protein
MRGTVSEVSALGAGIEHAVLVAHRESRVQRQHFGFAVLASLQRLVRVADLALARQEDQYVAAGILARDLVAGADDGVVHAAVAGLFALALERPIADAHRIATTFDIHDRRVVEMRGETLGVDRRRGDDDLEVMPFTQQLLQVTEQEIDVEAALVRFVDQDRVVFGQPAVGLDLGQQDAVGHELDRGAVADVVAEAHLVADHAAERRAQFIGDASRHRACGDASRLGATDHAGGAAACGQAQLRNLRGLARAGFACDHHHRMLADQFDDAFGFSGDRQRRLDRRRWQGRGACFALRHRIRQRLCKRGLRLVVRGLAAPARPEAVQAGAVATQRTVDGAPGLVQRGGGVSVDRFH